MAVVGRTRRQRDRRPDAGPLRDRHQQRGDGPGVRSPAPVDQRAAVELRARRRALHLLVERARLPPRADDARRGDLRRRLGRHQDGPRPSDRVVPDVRRRPDLGLEPRPLRRLLPRERRRQQPARASRRRRRAGSPGTAGSDNDCRGDGVVQLHAGPCSPTISSGAISLDIARGRQGLLDRDRRPGDPVRGPRCACRPGDRRQHAAHDPDARRSPVAPTTACSGMALDPSFDANRRLYVYYSPRAGSRLANTRAIHLGRNVVSRFTLNAAGTAVVPSSEQEIMRVPKVKVGHDNQRRRRRAQNDLQRAHRRRQAELRLRRATSTSASATTPTRSTQGRNWYAPIDQRYPQRYDARNTSANTNDLRGKILRIKPLRERRRRARPRHHLRHPRRQHVRGRDGEDEARDLRDGLPQPVHRARRPGAPRHGRRRRVRPRLGRPTARRADPPASSSGTASPSPPSTAGRSAPATTRTPTRYFRFTYPSGPTGARFDCSATEIPNESPYNTGLANLPGPAVARRRSGTSATATIRRGSAIPTASGSQEPITGPIYRLRRRQPVRRRSGRPTTTAPGSILNRSPELVARGPRAG